MLLTFSVFLSHFPLAFGAGEGRKKSAILRTWKYKLMDIVSSKMVADKGGKGMMDGEMCFLKMVAEVISLSF